MRKIQAVSDYAVPNYSKEVADHYAATEILRLIKLADEIEKNPSYVRSGQKHPGAIKANDFDWNVFADRVIHMNEDERKKNDPLHKCRLAISLLHADLSYDNKTRARKLLYELQEILMRQRQEQIKLDRMNEQEIKEFKDSILVSKTMLNDEEFLIRIHQAVDSEKASDWMTYESLQKAHTKEECRKQVREEVLQKEAKRYQQLIRDATSQYKAVK